MDDGGITLGHHITQTERKTLFSVLCGSSIFEKSNVYKGKRD